MLTDFFYTLRAAKVPVSVREYLTLLEALKAQVIGPGTEQCHIDDFYHLSRTVLVKDEKHFDKFDRAFGAYFKGVEMLTSFDKEIPLSWLENILQRELTPEGLASLLQGLDRAHLIVRAEAAKSLQKTEATAEVVAACEALAS